MRVVAAVTALLVAGCGGSTSEAEDVGGPPSTPAEALPIAVETSALLAPGTEIVEGVAVQEGTWLVGSAFPGHWGDESWQALLVLEGEPLAVWDRYAGALGIEDRASARQSCVVMRVGDPPGPLHDPSSDRPPTRFITEEPIDDENRVECRAEVDGTTMVLGYGPSYSPDLCHLPSEDQPWDCRRPTEAHLYLRSRQDDGAGYPRFATDELRMLRSGSGDQPAPVPSGEVIAPSFDLPPDLVPLPAAGEPVNGGLSGGPRWRLPDGARGVVAGVSLMHCTGSMATVWEVPGAPADAVEALLADAADGDRYGAISHGADARGRDWTMESTAEAGGLHVTVVALATTDEVSSVMLTSCND